MRLLTQAAGFEPVFSPQMAAAARLTTYATAFRYPGTEEEEEPRAEQLEAAIADAEMLLRQVLAFLSSQFHPEGYASES